jgi:hypothetical protein
MRFIMGTGSLNIIPTGRDWRIRWLAIAIFIAIVPVTVSAQTKDRTVANTQMTLWQAISALVNQIPFSKSKVEGALGAPLNELRKDEYAAFFDAKDIKFADGGRISNVDLRLPTKAGHPGFLVLSIDGTCITLDDVRQHYGELAITDVPRGTSVHEVTSHTATLAWGELSFSFPESNRNCLIRVAFDPKKH